MALESVILRWNQESQHYRKEGFKCHRTNIFKLINVALDKCKKIRRFCRNKVFWLDVGLTMVSAFKLWIRGA